MLRPLHAGNIEFFYIDKNGGSTEIVSEITREQLVMSVIAGRGPASLRGVDLSKLDLSGAGWLAGADLRQADLSNADLGRANLSGAMLEKADLRASNLAGANFEEANLSGARLNVATLRTANLKRANLHSCVLVGANLAGAILEEAELEKADLEGANLQGANLWKARLSRTNLRMADLRGAKLDDAYLEGRIIDQPEGRQDGSQARGFAGSVDGIRLPDLIQIVCLSRSNLLFRIESSEGQGIVCIGSGRVSHARMGDTVGEEAFFRMLRWENGRFETLPMPEGGLQEFSIDKPVEHLLIESMRRKDENVPALRREKRTRLIQEIRKYVPIFTYPSESLMELLCREGKDVSPSREIRISDAFDSADTEEILCSILVGDDVCIAPLRYLTISTNHPVFNEIAEYLDLTGC